MKPKKQSNLRYVYFEKILGSYYSPPTCSLSSYFYPPPLYTVDETEETVNSANTFASMMLGSYYSPPTCSLSSYFYPPPLYTVDETGTLRIRLLQKILGSHYSPSTCTL